MHPFRRNPLFAHIQPVHPCVCVTIHHIRELIPRQGKGSWLLARPLSLIRSFHSFPDTLGRKPFLSAIALDLLGNSRRGRRRGEICRTPTTPDAIAILPPVLFFLLVRRFCSLFVCVGNLGGKVFPLAPAVKIDEGLHAAPFHHFPLEPNEIDGLLKLVTDPS